MPLRIQPVYYGLKLHESHLGTNSCCDWALATDNDNCKYLTVTASLLTAAIDNMITNHGKGNPELVNLPRKINIGLATTRDDFAHTHINDVGLYAAKDPETGKVA